MKTFVIYYLFVIGFSFSSCNKTENSIVPLIENKDEFKEKKNGKRGDEIFIEMNPKDLLVREKKIALYANGFRLNMTKGHYSKLKNKTEGVFFKIPLNEKKQIKFEIHYNDYIECFEFDCIKYNLIVINFFSFRDYAVDSFDIEFLDDTNLERI